MNLIDKHIYDDFVPGMSDIRGWNGNSRIFQSLIESVKPSTIIEVGSWKGQSAINMASYLKEKKYDCKIFCVDTWLGSGEFWFELRHTAERDLCLKNGYPQIYYQFITNVVLADVQDYILPFPCTSTIAARHFKKTGIKAELIYIDASHEYEDVLLDIQNYFDLLAPNGIIFGDDYHSWPGVNKAVNEFCSNKNIPFSVEENNFWVISGRE